MSTSRHYSRYEEYKFKIAALPSVEKLEPKHLLNATFRIEHCGNLDIYCAPFDYVNRKAEIAIVGITPG